MESPLHASALGSNSVFRFGVSADVVTNLAGFSAHVLTGSSAPLLAGSGQWCWWARR